MHQIGSVDQMNALRFRLGQKIGEGAQGCRMWMADGHRMTFFVSIPGGYFQLAADRANILNIIEERHVAESARYMGSLRGVVRDSGRGGAAIDEEELMGAKQRHELAHEVSIGSCQ